jgi:hypothetical protein
MFDIELLDCLCKNKAMWLWSERQNNTNRQHGNMAIQQETCLFLTRRTDTIRHQNEKQKKPKANDEHCNHNAFTGQAFDACPITGTGNKTRRTVVTT